MMHVLFCTLGVASMVSAGLASGDSSSSMCTNVQQGSCWHNPGPHVVRAFQSTTLESCCDACDKEPKCLAFTQNFGMSICYLKDGLEIKPNDGNCTSGGTILPPVPSPPPPPPGPAPAGAKNVLLILFDDLRPELGLYGSKLAPTPNFDKLGASPGTTTFHNAYVQYSFCCPSRNSFVSGRRPTKTKTWQFLDDFREAGVGANWTTMPQWFKEHGYFVHGVGKIFHPGKPANSDPISWSDPAHVKDGSGELPVVPGMTAALMFPSVQADLSGVPCLTGEQGGSYCELNGTVGPDDALADNAVKSLAIVANYTKTSGHPFFLGVGFHKPHIPWTIPTRFFAPLGSIADIALPKHEYPPKGMPPIAWNKGLGTHALDSYKDANRYPLHAFSNGSSVAFPHDLTKAMRRGYYAAVSYGDELMGRVLEALDASGLADETVVAVMGDHGYNLGELNLWCKMTTFESGTRVPLIFRVPGQKGSRTSASLAEAVDLFPTLVEVAGASKVPEYCDGDSLAPVLHNSSATVKEGAFSEFVKCYSCCRVPDDKACHPSPSGEPGSWGRCEPEDPSDLHEMGNCFHVPRSQIDFIGYSVRTSRWRYTEWLHFDGTLLHGDFSRRVARELYDHNDDDGGAHDFNAFENENEVDDPANAKVVKGLHELLMQGFPQPAGPVAWPLVV